MSGFVDKLKVFLGVKEEYTSDEQMESTYHSYEEDVVPLRRERPKKQSSSHSGEKPTLVGLAGGQGIQNKMYIVEPTAFEDVKGYVQHLKNRKSLILRLHLLNKNEAQRVVDFMSGTTHALDGNMRKLGESIFCFTPSSVAIEGDLEADFFEMIKNESD